MNSIGNFCVFLLLGAVLSTAAAESCFSLDAEGKPSSGRAEIIQYQGVEKSEKGLRFNGKNGVIMLDFRKPFKEMTVVADVCFDRYPPKAGMIFSRPGCHNGMMIERSGRLVYYIYGADKKTYRVARSDGYVTPGLPHRIVGVVAPVADGGTQLTVYIDGVEVARSVLKVPVSPYDGTLAVGAGAAGGDTMFPVEMELRGLRVFDRALSAAEVSRLP